MFVSLNRLNWIGKHYYGSEPADYHKGRFTQEDFEFIKPLLAAQPYITEVSVLDPKTTEITHNLDRFREIFVNHPGNYVDCYSTVFGISDTATRTTLRLSTWLEVKNPRVRPGKPIVINRTQRWIPKNQLNPQWSQWKSEGIGQRAVFIGLPHEYQAFVNDTGIDLEYLPTNNMLEMAEIIAGAHQFIGNQSVALSLAIGLGTPTWCEYRRDLPNERNECWGFNPGRVNYF
jgi:ADP-heptose:LPS heptosyltransferase